MSSAELKNTEYDVLLTINAETFQRLSNIHEEAQKEHKFARFTVDLITVDEWHRDTDSVSSDKGADQPAEEVKAASEVRFIVVSNLDHHLAQQLADESQAGSEEEPAASKTQSESDVGSRKRARTESEVGSECSESIASKVGRLAFTVPTVPPSMPAAAPQAATAAATPKRSSTVTAADSLCMWAQKKRVAAMEMDLLDLKKKLEWERWQLAAHQEMDRRQAALQAAHGHSALGGAFGYYNPDPKRCRILNFFVKLWQPRTHLHRWGSAGVWTQSGGWPCRYICLFDARIHDTISDLKAKIVVHPDCGMLCAGDVHIFFRGKQLADDAILMKTTGRQPSDVIVHACTQDNAGAAAAASKHVWSLLNLACVSAKWQGGAVF